VEVSSLVELLGSLGLFGQEDSERVHQLLSAVDRDGDGCITFDDFKTSFGTLAESHGQDADMPAPAIDGDASFNRDQQQRVPPRFLLSEQEPEDEPSLVEEMVTPVLWQPRSAPARTDDYSPALSTDTKTYSPFTTPFHPLHDAQRSVHATPDPVRRSLQATPDPTTRARDHEAIGKAALLFAHGACGGLHWGGRKGWL
jgi:hypothetical protein